MLDVSLQPKQLAIYRLIRASGIDAATVLGFGGARGGAKSGAVRRCSLGAALEDPGTMTWIVRRVYDELKKDHIDPFFEDFPDLREYYRVGDKELILPARFGGSRIAFVHVETKDDVIRKFRGPQAKRIFLDQAEQFTEEEIQRVAGSNRMPGTLPGECKTILTFNPGGPGTEYLRRIFHLRQFRQNERPSDYAFIQAYGWDNYEWFRGLGMPSHEFYQMSNEDRYLMFIQETDFGRKLNSLPASLRMGELLGSFDSFSGQYFSDVWDESKCVLPPALVKQIVKPWWTRWMAQDWAFWEHTAHGWFASGKISPSEWMALFGGECSWPMEVVILYREHIVEHRAEADLANDIVARTPLDERRSISRFFLSQDAFGQKARQNGAHTVGQQVTDIMRRNQMPAPEAADQDRVNGWRFFANCLRQAGLRGRIFDQARAKEGPAFFISADCVESISGIPLAVRDEKDHNDVMRVEGALWEDVTDMCLIGSTPVMTPEGEVAICDLKAGDFVATRIGPRRVAHAWKARKDALVAEAIFSDGSKFIATPDHKVWTEAGFIRLDELRYCDKLLSWDQFLTEEETTNQMQRDISKVGEYSSIGRFGSSSAAQFLRNIIFTTRTVIGRTIALTIWSASPQVNISANITKAKNGNRNTSPHGMPGPLYGTSLRRDEHGIAELREAGSRSGQNASVCTAESPIRASVEESSAPTPASLHGEGHRGWTSWITSVLSAAKRFVATVMQGSGRAPANAVHLCELRMAGFADVYDIEVEEAHHFFAGGICVSNCRYGLKSMLDPKTKAPMAVRAQEEAARYSDPTTRNLAMLRFREQESRKSMVARAPRWRQ